MNKRRRYKAKRRRARRKLFGQLRIRREFYAYLFDALDDVPHRADVVAAIEQANEDITRMVMLKYSF